MTTYAIGDIHGQLKAFEQCLERCAFDLEKDHLICLGDIADRGPDTFGCFERLLNIKKLTLLLGNHDKWFLDWLEEPEQLNKNWLMQGGLQTIQSYQNNINQQMIAHKNLLQNAQLYFLDDKNRLFVHGGFEMEMPLEATAQNEPEKFYWDRSLWKRAIENIEPISYQIKKDGPIYENDIFIGHTNTKLTFPHLKPVRFQNVWNLDQGAAYNAKLTIMNVDTYQYWQSNLIEDLV